MTRLPELWERAPAIMRLAHFLHCSNGKTRGRPFYGKPLTIIELFRRLNQQFNDNFKKQGYHDINDKNKE